MRVIEWQNRREHRKGVGNGCDGGAKRVETRRKMTLKSNERSGNVYENKGPLWKTRQRSGNVYENKGT
jgi:hypothetical protein